MLTPELRRAATYYAITLGLAVALALAAPRLGEMVLLLTMATPTVAVLIMLFWVSPEVGWRGMPGLLGLNRAGLKGWPLAIGVPAAIHLAGFVVLGLTGLALFALPATDGSLAQAVVKFIIGLGISTVLALLEEMGWRGYMLPRMIGFGVVPAMLLVGFLHGVWHLPLLLGSDYYHSTGNPWLVAPLFLITLTLAGVVYGFLRLWTGSIWPVAIAHAAANNAWEVMNSVTQTKSPLVQEYVGGESGLIMIAGLAIFAIALIRIMRRKDYVGAIKL
jgi:membrane protease YdiL (CAAX protease family)